MAVGSVAVTEGSGKNLHTWQRSVSSVNREEQYVQLGEPGLPTFTAIASGLSAATSTSHLMQVMAGASTYLRILRVQVAQAGAAGTTTVSGITLLRLSSAGTGGTSVTARPMDASDSPAATAMTLPSSKGTEGGSLFTMPLLLTATTPNTVVWTWEPPERGKPMIIPAGTSNGLCVYLQTGAASATVYVCVTWTETAWL